MQDFTNFSPSARPAAGAAALSGEAVFFQRVYAWMFAGLGLTAAAAFILSSSEAWITFLLSNRFALIGAAIVQFGLVWYLSARVDHLSVGAARGIFLAYSALTGATFSVLLLVYPPAAIVKAFVCAAGVYGALALYGLTTRRSLQAWGSFLFIGVIGLLLATVVNIFTKSSALDMTICVIGVLIFAGLTAYDHQKLRVMRHSLETGVGADMVAAEGRVVIMGALALYLDFINIFIFLLRLFGRRE